jgi:hypothetical protein
MEIDMKIITYQCDWTNEWIAFDDNYADDFTPHGVGSTIGAAIEDLKNIMEQYLDSETKYNAWLADFLSYGD